MAGRTDALNGLAVSDTWRSGNFGAIAMEDFATTGTCGGGTSVESTRLRLVGGSMNITAGAAFGDWDLESLSVSGVVAKSEEFRPSSRFRILDAGDIDWWSNSGDSNTVSSI